MPWGKFNGNITKMKAASNKKKGAKKPKKVTKNVKTYVKAQIHRNIENKEINYSSGQIDMYNAANAAFGTQNTAPLTPSTAYMTIPQGNGEGSRVGNKVRVMKAILEIFMAPKPYDATTNAVPTPQDVQLFIYNVKPLQDSIGSVQAGTLINFFQNGSTSTAISGNSVDLLSDVNKDIYTLKMKRTFKLGYSQSSGTGGQVGFQYMSNNDYKMNIVRKFNVTKCFNKIIGWNDTSTTAYTKGVYFTVNPVSAFGAVQGGNQVQVQWQWRINLTFEDA